MRTTKYFHLPSEIVKYKASYTCQECGSTKQIMAHHQIKDDDNSLIVLCGECHAKRHPQKAALILSPKHGYSPYWNNISAASLAKKGGVCSRTIIRRAIKLGLVHGDLTEAQTQSLLSSYRKSYLMQIVGIGNNTIRTSLPHQVVEREARRLKTDISEFIKRYKVVWFFNSFLGTWITFEPKSKETLEQ